MQKTYKIFGSVKAFLVILIVLTSWLHFMNPLVMPLAHTAHQSNTSTHTVISVVDCSQQCPVLHTEKQIVNQMESDSKEPIPPFLVIISLLGITYTAYLLPTLLKKFRCIVKIPLYKQLSLYRI